MHHRATLFSFLVFSLVIGYANAWKDYKGFPESENFRNALAILAPQNLIGNYNVFGFNDSKGNGMKVNDTCARDLGIWKEALGRGETWAVKMLDASSKIPSGLLVGNIVDLGMFDECLQVRGGNYLGHDIQGRHCMYSVRAAQDNITIPMNPTLSICMPKSCTSSNVADLVQKMINEADELKELGFKMVQAKCATIQESFWDAETLLCNVILFAVIAFLVVCTSCEISYNRLGESERKNSFLRYLAKFSFKRNASAILDLNVTKDTIPVIHGFRALSMAWIVYGHEYLMVFFSTNVNYADFMNWLPSWRAAFIFVAPFAVDTFFAISGFLMTLLFLKNIPGKKNFNVPLYYLHRFLRLTPSVLALLIFATVYVSKSGSGARWDDITDIFISRNCRTKWWSILTYTQNFVDADNLCLGHLWYLAVDMQLFWISPFILYPLYKKPKLGLSILGVLLFTSILVPAALVGVRKTPAVSYTHSISISLVNDIFTKIYVMTYNRAGPWLIGIYLGYEVANYKRNLNKLGITVGWVVTALCFAFCIFGVRSTIRADYEFSIVWETIFSSISRPIWAIGICWIIYASIEGYAGPVSSILSWKYFLPFSKLSYNIYLVHAVFQIAQAAGLRMPQYVSFYNITRSYLNTMMLSTVTAFFFKVAVESPVLIILEMLLNRKKYMPEKNEKYEKINEGNDIKKVK